MNRSPLDPRRIESVRAAERRSLHQQAVQNHRKGQRQHGKENSAVLGQQKTQNRGQNRGAVGDDVLQAQAVDTVALMLARTNRRKPAWAGTEKGR